MFTIKNSADSSFWSNNKQFTNDLIKSGCLILALKVSQIAVDML